MTYEKNAVAFAAAAGKIASEYETVYALGMFGSPLSLSAIEGKARQYPKWYTAEKVGFLKERMNASSRPVFGFDCVCFLKALFWGWNGDAGKEHGGAVYLSNGVEDLDESTLFSRCGAVGSDFSDVAVGEALWMPGHIGLYLGDSLAVECTPAWENGVQITSVRKTVSGYFRRDWHKHGKLPYLDYSTAAAAGTESVRIDLPILQKGAVGYPVRTLQRLLNALLSAGLETDGSFGPATEAVLRAYQVSVSLEPDASCGPATWARLLKG
ncbi:MAG: peptidoglycan-binding protein [Lachnospiraceae bacterium]|nr:peptidoglycan-binding protein [Lachnospiraceae bacterium]